MDDFFVVGRDRRALAKMVPQIQNYLQKELALSLHPNKIYLQEVNKGVNFLGVTIKPNRRYLLNKTKKRINRRMHEIARNPNMDIKEVVSVVNSYFGYMKHLNCYRYKKRLVERNEQILLRGRFRGNYDKFVPWRYI